MFRVYGLERNPKLGGSIFFSLAFRLVFASSQFAQRFSPNQREMATTTTTAGHARLTANALARLMEEKPDPATFQPVLQIAGTCVCRE